MKKLILSLTLLIVSVSISSAQKKAQMNYDVGTLQTKTKIELTQIYMDKFQTLMTTLPYTSFTLKQDTVVVDSLPTGTIQRVKLDIPETKYTDKKREKVAKEASKYNEMVSVQLLEIIPYSDKNEIIWGIMFLQKMNDRLNTNF
jgi:hypothetical protein